MLKQGIRELDQLPSQSLQKKTSFCVHSRSIKGLVSLSDLNENKLLSNHVKNCDACKVAVKNLTLRIEQLKILVPRPQIDLQTKESFEHEVEEIFKTIKKNEKKVLRARIKQNLKNVDSSFVAFFTHLTSKKMLMTYCLATGIFFALKQVF